MTVVDLTHTITKNMPVYPGTETPKLTPATDYTKDGFKETLLHMYSHTGTHIDAPAHLYPDRTTLDRFPPEQFIGKSLVIDCRDLAEGESISMTHIQKYGDFASSADFLLFNTGWDKFWGSLTYFGDYPCINEEVLDYIIAGNFKGIGFDVISIDPISDVNLTRHKKLFAKLDIINIENLKNLELCGTGPFNFCCFPLKFKESDGAPTRAVAWWDE